MNRLKNKILTAIIAAVSAVSLLIAGCTTTAPDANDGNTGGGKVEKPTPVDKTYTATLSSLPEEWELYSQCDTAKTTTTFSDGNMVIKHANANIGASLYHGAVYKIDTEDYWTDFTFEMTFKMTEPQNNSRWLGVIYRSQMIGDNMTGYIMNQRYNGTSAASTVDVARTFHDEANEPSSTLSDGTFHTLKIEMAGTTAKHYMDDTLVKTWDVGIKNSCLGGRPNDEGGFAIIVNRCTLTISSCTIVGKAIEAPSSTGDNSIVKTATSTSPLTNAPTVVCDVTDISVLESLSDVGVTQPSNVILHMNKDADIVNECGDVIDSFKNIYTNTLRNTVIPIVYVSDVASAKALIDFLNEELDILDMAVMSSSAELIKSVKTQNSKIRAILEVDNLDVPYEAVKAANICGANVIVAPQSAATAEKVTYVQARLKTVWVRTSEESEIDIRHSVNSGAYGIVCTNQEFVYEVLDSYTEGGLTRPPFIVAHRGLPSAYNENSVTGVVEAIKAGATHVEIDGMMTKDGEILVMHDDTIDRTTNGSGKVSNMTLEQVRQYELDMKTPHEQIPVLDDILDVLEGNDCVLIFEIKANDEKLVEAFNAKIDARGLHDRVIAITFYTEMLGKMYEVMPETPVANLNTANINNFSSVLYSMGQFNTTVDTSNGNFTKEFNEQYLRDRGIIGWYWTYETQADVEKVINQGVVGITTNNANKFADMVYRVEGKLNTVDAEVEIGDEIAVNVIYYGGTQTELTGEVMAYEDMGDYYRVCAIYREDGAHYTQCFNVYKSEEALNAVNAEGEGCANSVNAVTIAVLTACALAFVIAIRSKKTR